MSRKVRDWRGRGRVRCLDGWWVGLMGWREREEGEIRLSWWGYRVKVCRFRKKWSGYCCYKVCGGLWMLLWMDRCQW
jgi:hypothetical protein